MGFDGTLCYAPLETRWESHEHRPGPDILRGTLDLLILKALSWGPAHGYTVARWVEPATGDALALGEGTLYPALHRLEERGWSDVELGHVREQPAGEVLRAHPARPGAAATSRLQNWRRYAAAMFAALDAPAPK